MIEHHGELFLLARNRISFILSILSALAPSAVGQIPQYTLATVDANCSPLSIAVDSTGNVFESCGNLIQKVSVGGTVTTVAGGGTAPFRGDGGPATNATLYPSGLAVDTAGNLYIGDYDRVRKVANGIINTIAGPGSTNGSLGDGGPALNATVSPLGLAVDAAGNLYVAEQYRIRKITPDGTITTVAGGGLPGYSGDGGPAVKGTISNAVGGIALDSAGNIYITDNNSVIRKISSAGIISTIAGNGSVNYSGDGDLATLAELAFPKGVAADATGNVYISDTSSIQGMSAYDGVRIHLVTPDGKINTIAGPFTPTPIGNASAGTIVSGGGSKLYLQANGQLASLTPTGKTFPVPGPSVSAFGGPYTFQTQNQPLGQGSYVTLYGNYLASNSRSWTGTDFSGNNAPTSLDGTSVTIGGQPAYVSYISPSQINAQVPTSIGTGAQPLIVKTSQGSSPTWAVTVNPTAPGLLAPPSFKLVGAPLGSLFGYVVALFSDGVTYVLPTGSIPGVPSRPAKTGDIITLYGIGFGSVTPNVPAGQVAQGVNPLAMPFHFYCDSVAGARSGQNEATVLYAGVAPGAVGLYQFNIVVPKLSTTGNTIVSYTLGGVQAAQLLFLATQ